MNIYKNTENPTGSDFSIAGNDDADYMPWADVRTNLTAVVIEDGVEGIGKNAFNGCTALKTFRVMPTTAPALGTNVFDGCTALTIIAPASYKTADGWKSEGIVEKLRADREDLFAGGKEVKSAMLTAANGWSKTFGGLPKFVDGHPIHYSVKEDPVKWYVTEIRGFTITNRYQPEVTSVEVRKEWDDNGNTKLRPKSIHMKLSNGLSVELNEKNGWCGVITELPKYVNGKEAVYTWTESEVLGYQIKSTEADGNLTVITNELYHNDGTPKGKKPATRGPGTEQLDDYDTPLGVNVIINHVGDCFD